MGPNRAQCLWFLKSTSGSVEKKSKGSFISFLYISRTTKGFFKVKTGFDSLRFWKRLKEFSTQNLLPVFATFIKLKKKIKKKIRINLKDIVQHVIWPIDQDKWSSGWEGVALQHTSQPRQTLRILDTGVRKE